MWDEKVLKDIISNIVKFGEKIGKLVVVIGNVYYFNLEDKIYWKILIGL